MKARVLLLAGFLGVGVVSARVAQRESLELPGRYFFGQFGEGWFAELHVVPAGDSLWAAILVRLTYAALAFEQDAFRGGFRAPVQIGVEFSDTVGIVRRRLEMRDTVWVREYEATVSRDSVWFRALQVMLPWEQLRCRLRLLVGQREVRQQELSVLLSEGMPRWSSPLLAVAGRADTLVEPFGLGGALPFGAHEVRLLVWDPRLRFGETYRFFCRQLPAEREELWWDSTAEIRGELQSLQRGRLELVAEGVPVYRMVADTLGGWLEYRLPAAQLVPGRYEFALVSLERGDTLRWRFRVVWQNMPISLRRVSYAVKSMRYLLTEQQWEQLRRGSAQEQWRKLWQYWKQRDPTPATAYNEAMAVYFRRVDHAYFAFQSVAEPDGAQSERGKIYILYGAPTRVVRDFPPGETPRELWIYERLHKRFLFELRSDGRWHLSHIEEMSNR